MKLGGRCIVQKSPPSLDLRVIATGGVRIGGYDTQIRTRPRFMYCAPTPKFHHPVFTRSEVIVLTNKQTNKQTPMKASNALRYATTLFACYLKHCVCTITTDDSFSTPHDNMHNNLSLIHI